MWSLLSAKGSFWRKRVVGGSLRRWPCGTLPSAAGGAGVLMQSPSCWRWTCRGGMGLRQDPESGSPLPPPPRPRRRPRSQPLLEKPGRGAVDLISPLPTGHRKAQSVLIFLLQFLRRRINSFWDIHDIFSFFLFL